MSGLKTELSFDDILVMAERASGAFDLADEGLRGRVRWMIDWINERGPYAPDQVRDMHKQVQDLLANRLRMALDRSRIPGIAEQNIERPIFVIGFPRSGTTLLHSLIAEDPECQTLRSWHMYSPSPPPGSGPVVGERIAFAQRRIEDWMDFCPAQKPMHPYIDKGAQQLIEDEESFTLDFQTAYPYHLYKVPTLEPMAVPDTDPVGAFSFHRELWQHLQWNTGKTRWAGKGPSHQNNLDALFKVYPDAICVWAHRPISQILPSIASLSAACYEAIQRRPLDPAHGIRKLAETLKAGFDRVMSNSLIDDPRVLHLPFKEVSSDPIAAVRKVYDKRGFEFTPDFEQRMRAWLGDPENAVDRYGRYPYGYERLGVTQDEIEDMFSAYSQRFGLT